MFKLMIAIVTNAIDVNRSLSIWLSLKSALPKEGFGLGAYLQRHSDSTWQGLPSHLADADITIGQSNIFS